MRLPEPTKRYILFFVLVIGSLFASRAQEVVPFTARLDSGNIKIRGDILFVGNNILNRATQADPAQADTPYDGGNNNNGEWMEYIDIDGVVDLDGNGTDDTFSSSSAELNLADPSCSQVRYAGLYWAATYPNERSTDGSQPFSGTPRIEDWFNVRFRVPGGNYVALTADTAADSAGQEDDIIFDGYDYADIDDSFKDSPYVCYKNVTDLVRSNSDPTGEYTMANIRATRGQREGGGSAGWVLVVIYENPNESGKFISTFDGYAGISGSTGNVDVAVNGFRTLPAPFPVRARIGVGALEGDRALGGDEFRIKANSVTGFTRLSAGTTNPNNNFFNSTITTNGNQVPTRNPFGTNTLGTDLDLFNLDNPSNSVLPNDESGATLRFTSSGDGYGPFLSTFAVEIIEPNIVLEKRVEDIAGNDITDGGVNLGQTLDYVLSFRNLGNDHAENYTIRDVLPTNTSYESFEVSGAPGVTASYNAATNEVSFVVPDNLVQIGDPVSTIRLRVEVASNCFDFVDACSYQIQNLAYSTYQGEINTAPRTDDPSVSDFDNCGFVTPGTTNFLLDDLSDCNFERTVQLCGADAVLDAGDGFDSYEWYRDENGNNQIDAGVDTPLNDGDPDNDPSTLLVDDIGTYIVDKIIPAPCIGYNEIIAVERFGSTQTNPIIDYFNDLNGDTDLTNDIQGEIVTCSVDGDLLPKIFLCGAADSQPIQINITDALSLSWERLDESSCAAAAEDCANKNLTCSWNQVASGNNYTADTAGKYRLVINYTNGCFSRFYFDVFQNNLEIDYTNRDIICTSDGSIQITNLGSNYGYQLVDDANSTILVPFSAGHGPVFDFTSGENGSYRVEVVQLDGAGDPIPDACIFSTDPIGIRDRDFQVDITTTPANCNSQGSIQIDVLNVSPDYTYVLRRSDGTFIDDETAQSDNTHTFTVNDGNYTIEVSTADGCFTSQNVTVGRTPDPTLSALTTADIGCTAGTIELTRTGGQGNPDFLYAIWSKDNIDLYPDITSVPADKYQVSSTFNFGWRDEDGDGTDEYISGEAGTYEFIIIDANNCSAFSNPVAINDNGATTIDSITETRPSCSGDRDGALTINVSGGVGPYTYSIDNGVTYQNTPNFVNLGADTYMIRVLDNSGCDVLQTYSLSEPFPLSASAGVSRDATCDPNGAEVRVTNVAGGNPPYEYSFDGGATYGSSTIAVLPPGAYTVIVRDGSCEFPMNVTVEDEPTPPTVTLTPEVSYGCGGSGTITATPNIASYNYTYALDGVLNSPDPTSNAFPNVAPGTYTVTTYYSSSTPPTPSLLLSEDFGFGTTIPNPNTSGYFYENQQDDVTPSGAPVDNGRQINDYEYAVTSNIERPFGSWLNPTDHTSGDKSTQGRYLVINIGAPSPGQIIYQKPINDIIHNQPIEVSLWLINLLRSGQNGVEPDLTLELRDPGSGAVVATSNTGAVPENDIWNEYVLSLNPGANSTLDLVVTTNESQINGNDVAIDDITVYQTPVVCEQSVETPVTVVAGKTFAASITGTTNVSCNGQSNATLTFRVENFDATVGFEYSINGGSFIGATTSPVTTTVPLGPGDHTIELRKADETGCSRTLTQTITEPGAVAVAANITTLYSCNNAGATITASAADGIAPYEYRLEDTSGGVIRPFQSGTTFTNVTDGNYIIRARDNNGCDDEIDAPIQVDAPATLTFTAVPTPCYSGGNDATISVNVTGGNGGLLFSINGNPFESPDATTPNSYVFDNLGSGSYTINVQDQLGCTTSAQTVDIEPAVTLTASAAPIPECANSTEVTINAAGGDTAFVYALVADGDTPSPGDFNTNNTRTISAVGDYDVYARDKSGGADFCEARYDLEITKDAPLAITVTNSPVKCSGASQSTITVAVTGGSTPYRYSIDDGATYQTTNTFPNLPAGSYDIRVQDSNTCEEAQIYAIAEPFTLSASALVAELIECNPTAGAEVRIVNARGGTAPYAYSFDGGATYQASNISNLFPGDHTVFVRDANNCSLPLDLTVLPPQVPPGVTTSLDYFCDGEAAITITPDNPLYDYTYELDNVLNTPADSNVFANVPAGDHVVTVNYVITTIIPPSTLLTEDFGFGSDTPITEIDPVYCYEPQNGSPSCPGFGTDTHIQDGEYTVTQGIANPYGTWIIPNDHTGNTDGRYLAINVGGVAGVNGIVYAKRNIEVLPQQDISISLWAMNLLKQGTSGGDPSFEIQLVDSGGNIIASTSTGNVSKNSGPDDWRNYSVDLNPGSNTNLDIVIRTNSAVTNGNDIAIDDLLATQPPAKCPAELSIDVHVEAGKALEANITATSDVSCNGASDGSISFDVSNFDVVNGFEYSIDGGTTFIGPETTAPITITGLVAGAVNIEVRDVLNHNCTITLSQAVAQPNALETSASITQPYTCDMPGATITASAVGGTPTYEYQLENTGGTIIVPYQTTTTFTNVPVGDYIVRGRDANGCTDPIDTPIPIVEPLNPTFTAMPTSCYSGNNDAAIQVDVLTGNSNYQFSINGGPWLTPSPSTAATYTFQNLSSGIYAINVKDQYGCIGTPQNITINPQLTANAVVNPDLTCTAPASVTINANGGSGTYSYEWSNDSGITYATTDFTGNVFNTIQAGTYIFKVTDTSIPSACAVVTTPVTITPADTPVIASVTPTNILCNGDLTGTLDITIDTSVGRPVYTIEVLETNTSINYGPQTSGLPAGDYEVRITDDKGCVSNPFPVLISEPDAINPNISKTDLLCTASGTELGSITVDASGGTATYIYKVFNADFSVSQSYDTSTGTNDHTFTGLDFGDYTVSVTDSNNCEYLSSITITTGPDVLITTQGASGCTPGSGEMLVEAQASNGTLGIGSFYFAVYPAPPFSITDPAWHAEDPSPPATANSHLFTGLTPGVQYTFIVHDTDTNCDYLQEATVPVSTSSTLVSTIDATTDITCTGNADGVVAFTISGYGGTAVSYEVFSLNTNVSQGVAGSASGAVGGPESDALSGIAPGEFYILFTETNGPNSGCVVASDPFIIEQAPTLLEVTANSPKNDNCNDNAGTINAQARFGKAPYEFQYLLYTAPPPIATSTGWVPETFANVDGGDYIVYVKDANDCIQTDAVSVALDPSPEISATIVDECVAEGTFEALVTLDGAGISPYFLSVNGGAFQSVTFNASNEYTITGLSSGIGQTFEIRDQNGCGEIATRTIHTPLQYTAIQTVLLDCEENADANAQITIEVTSGSGGYELEIDGPGMGSANLTRTAFPILNPTVYVWDGASIAGAYVIRVFDINTNTPNCYKTVTIDVPNATVPVFTETHTDVTCNGGNDGTITLQEINNGVNPLTYTLTPTPSGAVLNGTTFENLPAGFYDVSAKGTNDCSAHITGIEIREPTPITVPAPTVVEFGCTSGNNPNNARIEIAVASGGSGNFVRYEFINNDDPDTAPLGDAITVQDGSNATYIETDVRGGSYTINVYDDKGCVGTQTASIAPYDELLTATTAITNVISCSPGNDAEITVSVTSTQNDPSKFEYSIDNGATYQTSNIFPNLGIGTHVFLIRHVDTGCLISASQRIEDPNTFTIDINKISDVVCFGTVSGEVTFALSDATYAGGFDWEIFNTNGTAANTADDTSMATGTETTNGPTAGTNLPAGSYYVTVSQSNAPTCTNTEAFTINGPTAAITADTKKTEVTCNLNDGNIEIVDVLGGWGGYTYFVTEATDPVPTDASGFQTSPLFTNLSGGTGAGTDYQVWVADSHGCLEQLPNVNLVDPDPISADLQINVEHCTNFEGEIQVINVLGGQGSNYSYQLQVFNPTTSVFEDSRPLQTSDVFGGLAAGRYQVIVSDQWNCNNPTTAPVALYEEIAPTAAVVKTIDCTGDPGGQITISQTGGSGAFTYTVTFPDGSTPQPSNTDGIFTGLTQVGEYAFTVTDDRSCSKTIRRSLQPQVEPLLSVDSVADVICFGDATGTIAVSVLDNGVGPYTFQITDRDGTAVTIDPTSFTDTTAEFTGLTSTTTAMGYTITVTGTNSCADTVTQTIAQPAAAVDVPAPTPVSFGCSTGNVTDYPTIDITGVTGGSGTYVRYEFINNDNPATTGIVDAITVQDGSNASYTETNLAGGTYTINVYDSKGCMGSTTTTIDPFVSIVDPIISVDHSVTCNTFDENITVSVTVDPATMTPNLQYEVSGINVSYAQTNATGVFTGLGVGNYAIAITNLDTGCVIDTVHSVEDPDVIQVTATKRSDEECLNDSINGGSFEVTTIAGYIGNYSYQVYDDNHVPLPGAQYSGTGNTATPLPPFTDLLGGVYYVRITETDAPFCFDDSGKITILAPSAPITATIREEANVTCSNDQGRLLVDPVGGEGPYTIVLDNTTTSQEYTETDIHAHIFEGLSAGDFNVTVTDAFGCVFLDTIELIEPNAIDAYINTPILTCFNGNDASITTTLAARANPIAPVYQYQLWSYGDDPSNTPQASAFQFNPGFTGLSAGFYRVLVKDNVSCSDESNIIEIVNPTEVEADLIRTSPMTCMTDIELRLTASGGSGAPYQYFNPTTGVWEAMDDAATNDVKNLSFPNDPATDPDVYQFRVRDSNFCESVLSNEISEREPVALTLTVNDDAAMINCFGDSTAVIYADTEGGLGNYRYQLFTDASLTTNFYSPGHEQASGEFRDLPSGTYYVNVISGDCPVAPVEVIIDPAIALTYADTVTNVSCEGANDGSVMVTLSGGAGGYQYAISPNLDQFDDENTFDRLAPGVYRVIAQDRNGCFIEMEYTITEPNLLEVSATALPEVCAGEENGSIELSITGGTAPYSTRLSSETRFEQDRAILSDLAPGSYIIFVRDANGCEENVSISVDPGVNLGAMIEPVYGCDGNIPNNYINIILDDANISDEVLYALDSTDPADMQLNPFFRNIAPGAHYVAISHANGCVVTHDFEIDNYDPLMITVAQSNINELTATVTGGREDYTIYFGDVNNGSDTTFRINRSDTYIVTVVDENGCEATAGIFLEFIDIDIPNFFSPNGDAENQNWKPRNDEGFPEILTIIFDRYGREVYRMGQGDRGWDGFYQQKELPTGDYWYVIKLKGENDDREFVGHFTLYR